MTKLEADIKMLSTNLPGKTTMSNSHEITRDEARRHLEDHHGMYRIVAGNRCGLFEAVAYAGTRKVAQSDGEDADECVQSLKAKLDERGGDLKRARVNGVPTREEYYDAISVISGRISDKVIELILIHSRARGLATTFSNLSRATRVNESFITSEYARLGRRLSIPLNFLPGQTKMSRSLMPVLVIAQAEQKCGADATWTLRPEFVDAFQAAKFICR